MARPHLCIHGHFYQPPREDPFTGKVPDEFGAAPYRNFNDKIDAECYRPNARCGNFARMSFDLGPTLAHWLAEHDPETYRLILASERRHREDLGQSLHSNALAQAYNHTILPLATAQEKRVQIAWGIADYQHRFGHRPEGMWLAETAVDRATLNTLAELGIKFTILAPWQAKREVDPTEPYLVPLDDGRSIAVFFYNADLSGNVSFNPDATTNADHFTMERLRASLNSAKARVGQPQIVLVATDGELYGHHQPFRDKFLDHLLRHSAPSAGFALTSLASYLAQFPPRREVAIWDGSSWSCHHGVSRWRNGCSCTEGDGAWKWHLRDALNRLAARLDWIYETETSHLLHDPWRALDDYYELRVGAKSLDEYLEVHAGGPLRPRSVNKLLDLLESQYYRHLMFTSCAFFFEDLDRIEPRNNIAYAARAIALTRLASGYNVEYPFLADLQAARSWRSGRDGAMIYRDLTQARGRLLKQHSPLVPGGPFDQSLTDRVRRTVARGLVGVAARLNGDRLSTLRSRPRWNAPPSSSPQISPNTAD